MRGPGPPPSGVLNIDLKSPGMVAAVLAASPGFRPPHYPTRETVKRKRDLFERGLSEPLLRINNSHHKKLERGRSHDLIRYKKENEAQRLVKYRSASSLISVDSGFGLSRGGSAANSTEDLRLGLTRSVSHDRLHRRKSSSCSSSSSTSENCPKIFTRSATTNLLHGFGNYDDRSYSRRRDISSPQSEVTCSSTPDLTLPDLLLSPPPLPPKKRPPLPPRRKSNDVSSQPPPRYTSPPFWDFESDVGSGHTSDASLPEYLVDDDGLDSEGSKGHVRGHIPESFPFKNPLQKFLADLGQSLSTEVIIKNVYGGAPGNLDVTAHTVPLSGTSSHGTSVATNIHSLPQNGEVPRPSSLSPSVSHSPVPTPGSKTALSKKYRTELQVNLTPSDPNQNGKFIAKFERNIKRSTYFLTSKPYL